MTQTQQLSDLMQKAEGIVQEATALSTEEYRMLTEFLIQRLKLVKAQEDIQAMKVSSERGDTKWSGKSILQLADELNAKATQEELAQHPSDGAKEHDHYVYGTPKKSAR